MENRRKSAWKGIVLGSLLVLVSISCAEPKAPQPIQNDEIANVISQMTDIMIHDVTNPPLAAKFFAYASLAGMEALSYQEDSLSLLSQKINGYSATVNKIKQPEKYEHRISAVFAMLHTAKKMQPSGSLLEVYEDEFAKRCLALGFDQKIIDQSKAFGIEVSGEILKYAATDNYNKTSGFPKYTPLAAEGSWYPTPPGFFAPVEPYFNTLRPFFLDSASQFKPISPARFSTDKNSPFYKMMEEVYQVELTEEKKLVAAFWDCNPFALEENGHLMIGMKKISPGAHWMGIGNIACKVNQVGFDKAMEINGVLAMSLHDAFMGCWDEKYRSNRIRPETIIRKLIDPNYKPLLQTPPFPEYLSGHSVVSTASAVVLTHYFGENFAYTDTVEVKFGLPTRDFEGFHQAAEEAAISRLYGGIHFMDAITEGQKQGREIGSWTIDKLFSPLSKN
ncbi:MULTISPECIES: vanadium-dependent haloperoxidase [Rhodonellum]|nr:MULTISPECIES: vanadium-dependent haloperoxidase [Rhodonellum]SDY66181.1 PAP2 superfamily protein [Rhodonellum ikkaensis]